MNIKTITVIQNDKKVVINESDYDKNKHSLINESIQKKVESGEVTPSALKKDELLELAKIYDFEYSNLKDGIKAVKEVLKSLELDKV